MNEISRYVPITKAKNDLLELIRQVENVDESVAVTKNGVPAAVILSMEKYAGLIETLDILSDEDTAKSLRTSIRQARKGKWLRPDEVFRRSVRSSLVTPLNVPASLPSCRLKSSGSFDQQLTRC